MLFRKETKEYKPLWNIAEGSLREIVATFLVVFAITSFSHISQTEVLGMHPITLYVFNGIFFGAGLFIFNADMNPAFTFARWIRGLINFPELLARWTSQLGAALLAMLLVKLIGGSYGELMWNAYSLTAIDIVMIEGFFIAILITILFARYKKSYKPIVFASIFTIIQILIGTTLNTNLNFLFVIAPSIIFGTFTWPITFIALAHLGAVTMMVIFWIKESWTD